MISLRESQQTLVVADDDHLLDRGLAEKPSCRLRDGGVVGQAAPGQIEHDAARLLLRAGELAFDGGKPRASGDDPDGPEAAGRWIA